VKVLHVEVDAKYIKGMLSEPDLQPNATINQWIQGILLFDFKLIHVPASKFRGEGKSIDSPDDSWLDKLALYSGVSQACFRTKVLPKEKHLPPPAVFMGTSFQEQNLKDIFKFLTTLETLSFESISGKKQFLKKAVRFFVQNGMMY
jgi:hypothetical protein